MTRTRAIVAIAVVSVLGIGVFVATGRSSRTSHDAVQLAAASAEGISPPTPTHDGGRRLESDDAVNVDSGPVVPTGHGASPDSSGYNTGLLAPGPRIARVRIGVTQTAGPIPDAAIKRVLREALPAVRACYEREVAERPELAGRVTFALPIDATGAVPSASIEASTLLNAAVEACALATLHRLRFPASREGGLTTVTLPLVFTNDS